MTKASQDLSHMKVSAEIGRASPTVTAPPLALMVAESVPQVSPWMRTTSASSAVGVNLDGNAQSTLPVVKESGVLLNASETEEISTKTIDIYVFVNVTLYVICLL